MANAAPHFVKSRADFRGIATINAKAETLQSSVYQRAEVVNPRIIMYMEVYALCWDIGRDY